MNRLFSCLILALLSAATMQAGNKQLLPRDIIDEIVKKADGADKPSASAEK